ncbi:tryptophan--tRNA ligase, partial [Streptomyces hydrogenans]
EELAGAYASYGALKKDTADAVVELLRPVRERHDRPSGPGPRRARDRPAEPPRAAAARPATDR